MWDHVGQYRTVLPKLRGRGHATCCSGVENNKTQDKTGSSYCAARNPSRNQGISEESRIYTALPTANMDPYVHLVPRERRPPQDPNHFRTPRTVAAVLLLRNGSVRIGP